MENEVVNKTEPAISNEFELDVDMDALDNATIAADSALKCRQRFALVCDATGSMQSVWREAQDALKKAVDQIKSRANVPVQLQVVAYRDVHDGPEAVCEASEWSDDTDYLLDFIKSIKCHGGGDYPESVGVGLRQLLQQQAKLVILIGDAPGKQPDTGFEEATIMGREQCPIYALYTDTNPRLVSHFEKLARLSGGKAMLLKNFKDLTDLISVLLTSNKALQISYTPETESGKRAKALLGA